MHGESDKYVIGDELKEFQENQSIKLQNFKLNNKVSRSKVKNSTWNIKDKFIDCNTNNNQINKTSEARPPPEQNQFNFSFPKVDISIPENNQKWIDSLLYQNSPEYNYHNLHSQNNELKSDMYNKSQRKAKVYTKLGKEWEKYSIIDNKFKTDFRKKRIRNKTQIKLQTKLNDDWIKEIPEVNLPLELSSSKLLNISNTIIPTNIAHAQDYENWNFKSMKIKEYAEIPISSSPPQIWHKTHSFSNFNMKLNNFISEHIRLSPSNQADLEYPCFHSQPSNSFLNYEDIDNPFNQKPASIISSPTFKYNERDFKLKNSFDSD